MVIIKSDYDVISLIKVISNKNIACLSSSARQVGMCKVAGCPNHGRYFCCRNILPIGKATRISQMRSCDGGKVFPFFYPRITVQK